MNGVSSLTSGAQSHLRPAGHVCLSLARCQPGAGHGSPAGPQAAGRSPASSVLEHFLEQPVLQGQERPTRREPGPSADALPLAGPRGRWWAGGSSSGSARLEGASQPGCSLPSGFLSAGAMSTEVLGSLCSIVEHRACCHGGRIRAGLDLCTWSIHFSWTRS